MWALHRLTVFTEKVRSTRGIHYCTCTVLTAQAVSAAWHCGEDIVRVHGSDHERTPHPCLPARQASELSSRVLQALHTHSIQIEHLSVRQHLKIHVVTLGGEEEGAVDQGVLVVHGEGRAAHCTVHLGHLAAAQVREDEAAGLVVPVRAFVFHLYMVGVLLVAGQHVKHGIICAAAKDIPSCSLIVVGEKIKF